MAGVQFAYPVGSGQLFAMQAGVTAKFPSANSAASALIRRRNSSLRVFNRRYANKVICAAAVHRVPSLISTSLSPADWIGMIGLCSIIVNPRLVRKRALGRRHSPRRDFVT
jgi:hypothetical protein